MTDIIRDVVDAVLTDVNAISAPGPGYTRPSYSTFESAAHRVVERRAEELGLAVTRDAAMNLFARLPGRNRNAPALYVGSHLDTVSMGGGYDGSAGIAGAMALAAAFVEDGEPPPVDLVVTVLRAEESVWFPASYIGSRAALGRLRPGELDVRRSDTGRSLSDHMREEGGAPDAVLRGPGLPPARFIEMHIEQGPVLFDADEAYALVTGVRGGLRYRHAQIHGTWAHSGGAPRESRADAVFAFADLVTAMDRIWAAELAAGQDLAITFGRVDAASPEHAFAKVPGHLGFCIDIRSRDVAELDRLDASMQAEIRVIEARRGVRFDLGLRSRSQPAPLSEPLVEAIAEGARRRHQSPRRMLSGGGHDAAAFAAAGWEAVMIFLRNWNGSHNPAEGMDPADLAEAVRTLRATWTDADGVI